MFGIFGRKNGNDHDEQLERELEEATERVRKAGDDVSKVLRRICERKREAIDGAE